MATFKNKKSGKVIEVEEEFANQVLRPQGRYEEIFPIPEVKAVPEVKVSKKKSKKSKD